MASDLEVIWTDEASRNLNNIVHYLQTEWTIKEVNKFFLKLNKVISLIAKKPQLFRMTSERRGLRKCVLTKHTSIFYIHVDAKIFIISLFDNRQDPKKTPQ